MKKYTNIRKVKIGLSVSEYWNDSDRSIEHRKTLQQKKSKAHRKKISDGVKKYWKEWRIREDTRLEKELKKYLDNDNIWDKVEDYYIKDNEPIEE